MNGRILAISKTVYDEYTIPAGDAEFQAAVGALEAAGKKYVSSEESAYRAALERYRACLKKATEIAPEEEPNFFRIGYLLTHGETPDPAKERVSAINERARARLDSEFMNDFLKDVQAALRFSAAEAVQTRGRAISELRKELPVFDAKVLDRKQCTAAAKRAGDAVEQSIDRLALDKDNQSYVFKSSMLAYIDRYFTGLKHNPKEQRRFARDTERFERDTAKGKSNVPSVVPINLIDTDKAKAHMTTTMENLIAHFEQLSAAESDAGSPERAVAMIDYLKDRSSEYAYRLSQGMARHRAIELMKEVGIPEPHRRFHQYPFEFSGGMRQRIVIAIALSANPDILICDEPTTALDVTIQAQILELINRLKKERRLSVIFITHDLGVVANMADRIAIMYAGKIVEYGTADDVFYDPRHPYTWALLASMPDLETKEKLDAIPGTPPDMILPPKGDACAARNRYAMQIDFEEQPPMFQVSETHQAATWLLHPNAPKVTPPAIVTERIERMKRKEAAKAEGGVQA